MEPADSSEILPDERAVACALGSICDGHAATPLDWQLLRQALAGAVATARGPRRYYADLDTLTLGNIDTEEGIWSVPADGVLRDANGAVLIDLRSDAAALRCGAFPLEAAGDPARIAVWQAAMQRASNAERRRWAAFTRRVLRPLARALAKQAR